MRSALLIEVQHHGSFLAPNIMFHFFSEMQEGVAVGGVTGQTEMDHLQDVSVCLREWSNF